MKGYDYNKLLSVFYVSYIIFEIPSNMVSRQSLLESITLANSSQQACKWIGPGWFLPAISLGFGIASVGTAFVHTLGSACAVRFVLGIFEAGMLPGIAYYLSR